MYRSTSKAFTLIELLVVISIVSLLISILLPALQSAREAGKVSQDLSNMRQITIAKFAYAADNREHLVWSRFNTTTGPTGLPYWPGAIAGGGYVSNPFIFWGPFRQPNWLGTASWTSRETTIANPRSSNAYERADYGINLNLMPTRFTGTKENSTYRLGDVVPGSTLNTPRFGNQPSVVILMSQFFFNSHAGTADALIFGKYTGISGGGIFCPRGAASRAYLDGHAASRSPDDLGWIPITPISGNWVHVNATVPNRWYWHYPL